MNPRGAPTVSVHGLVSSLNLGGLEICLPAQGGESKRSEAASASSGPSWPATRGTTDDLGEGGRHDLRGRPTTRPATTTTSRRPIGSPRGVATTPLQGPPGRVA
eukprot:4250422-Pyramimonas_sp.AAC.1